MIQTKSVALDIDTAEIANRVISSGEYWIPRSKSVPFFTFGRSAYLDGKTPAYTGESKKNNDLLSYLFTNLYIEVTAYLAAELKEPVYLSEDLAIPGFHIFRSDPAFLEMSGEWHTDYPHITLGLGATDASTFTVPIMLPSGGAGLDWFDGHEKKYMPYEEGVMVWHTGLEEHRIARLFEYVPGEFRITMQGHLIRRNGDMEVFF